MVPAFIEVVEKGSLEPTLINTNYIVRVIPDFTRGCHIVMRAGGDIETEQEYVTIFEELQ